MFDLLRAEALKTLTTRATLVLLGGAVAVVALATASTILSMPPGNLNAPIHEQVAYFIAAIGLAVFGLIIGCVPSPTSSVDHRPNHPRESIEEPTPSRQDHRRGGRGPGDERPRPGHTGCRCPGSGRDKGWKPDCRPLTRERLLRFGGRHGGLVGSGHPGLGAMVRNQLAGVAGALVWVSRSRTSPTDFLVRRPGTCRAGLPTRWRKRTLA